MDERKGLITDYYKNINTENLLIKQACVHVWVVGEGLRHPYLTVYFHSYSFEDVPLLWFLENPRYLRKVIWKVLKHWGEKSIFCRLPVSAALYLVPLWILPTLVQFYAACQHLTPPRHKIAHVFLLYLLIRSIFSFIHAF